MNTRIRFKASTRKTEPLISTSFWKGLVVIILAPMVLIPEGISTYIVYTTTAFLGYMSLWLYFAYKDMERRHDMCEALYLQANNARCQMENSYKDMEMVLSETEDAYKKSIDRLDALLSQLSDLKTQLDGSHTKDAVIDALKRRVANISAEYNDKHSGNRSVTLADVYKLTGEGK